MLFLTIRREDGKYNSLGRHGVAIIGSKQHNTYEIIIYKEKNNILLREKVNTNFSLINQDDSFSTFYTAKRDNWLLKFDNKQDQNYFSEQIVQFGGKIENNSKKEKNTKKDENPKKEDSVRADILSRMAKMGQQILPDRVVKNSSTDLSDSELDDSKNERKITPRKNKRPPSIETSQQIVSTQLIPTQIVPQTVPYDNLGFVVAQNTELKLNLAQISNKLDLILSGNQNRVENTDESLVLKSKLKSLELQNENLLTELNRMQKKSPDDEKLKDDLIKTKLALDLALERNKNIENQLNLKQEYVKSLESTIADNKLNLERSLEANKQLEDEINELKNNEEELKVKLKAYELKQKDNSEVIKQHMNEMYQNLVGNFPNGQHSSSDIQNAIGKSIKTLTYKLIHELQ